MAEKPAKKDRFEDHLKTVEEAVRALESGKLDLEESLEKYEKGVAALRRCYEILAEAERRLEEVRRRHPLPGDEDAKDGDGGDE